MPKLDLATIEKRIAELQNKAETLKQEQDKGPAIAAVVALMVELGVTIRDLRNSESLPGFNARKPVKPKYRNPETGEIWTGRGMT